MGGAWHNNVTDFTKGPATICVINLTEHDLILKSGQEVADLSHIELSNKRTTNTESFLDSKTGETYEAPHLHTLFPTSIDGSKRNDNF